MTYAEGQFRSV